MSASSSGDAPTKQWPTWFASTPYEILDRQSRESGLRPYGILHARRAESGLTACGEYAVGWRIFWELPFSADRARACAACVEALASAPDETAPRRRHA